MPVEFENPPLEEVVFELLLPPDHPWDQTIPGLIFHQIREKGFTVKETAQIQQFLTLPTEPKPRFQISHRSVFKKADLATWIQVGQRLLAVNKIKPYNGWENFKPDIELAVDVFSKEVNPASIGKMALKYINVVRIPETKTSLNDYFEFGLRYPIAMGNEPSGFIAGCIFPRNGGRDDCKVELQTGLSENKDERTFVLLLEYGLNKKEDFDLKEIISWVQIAHDDIEKMFKMIVTKKLRELFKPV